MNAYLVTGENVNIHVAKIPPYYTTAAADACYLLLLRFR